jgi:hypothetical protein
MNSAKQILVKHGMGNGRGNVFMVVLENCASTKIHGFFGMEKVWRQVEPPLPVCTALDTTDDHVPSGGHFDVKSIASRMVYGFLDLLTTLASVRT